MSKTPTATLILPHIEALRASSELGNGLATATITALQDHMDDPDNPSKASRASSWFTQWMKAEEERIR